MSEEVVVVEADGLDAPIVARPDDSSRRVRRYAVAERDVLDVFARMGEGLPACVRVPRLDIPAGATVVPGVYHDWFSRTFQFAVTHPDFEPVPDGAVIPRADEGYCTGYTAVRLAALGPALIAEAADAVVARWSALSQHGDLLESQLGDPMAGDEFLRREVAAILGQVLGG